MGNEGCREDVNSLEYAWDCGDGCPFVFSFCRYLVLNLFPFPRTPAQLLGNDLLIKECAADMTLPFITHQYNGAANVLRPFQVQGGCKLKYSSFKLLGSLACGLILYLVYSRILFWPDWVKHAFPAL